MNCPKCKGENVGHIAEDVIPCCECGAKLELQYWICVGCNMTYRVINGGYLDSFRIDHDSLEVTARELGTAVQELSKASEEKLEKELNAESEPAKSMSDLVHHCLKCECTIVIDEGATDYKCPACGFEWEVLK
jgi:hypothetical protein